jgi:predicted  nucleic acid-binding Zn-ribbon protein
MKDNSFSNFIRNGTPEKKKEVYNDVINESIQDQKQSMTSTIEKEGNLLPHNTTEELTEQHLNSIKILQAKIGYSGTAQEFIKSVEYFLKDIATTSHNLALQQVVEVLKREKDAYELAYKKIPNETSYPVRIDQIDDLQSIITSLQKE